jgi:hypothetical protein
MTATINRPKHVGKHRRPPRFAVMEALGFIDVPGSATRQWVAPAPTAGEPVPLQGHTPRQVEPEAGSSPAPPPVTATAIDPFADWEPTEVGGRQLEGRVRWGLVALIVFLAASVGVAGYWLYRQPQIAAEEARSHVESEAAALLPLLDGLETAGARVTQPDFDPSEIDSLLLEVDSQARDLFEVSGSLAGSDQALRSSIADAAGDAMDAARLIGEAVAYRGAVVPILIVPALETDPELVTLEAAAATFSDWQARFDRVLGALPSGLATVTDQLRSLSGDLTGIQREYLDTLRQDDADGVATVVRELEHRLSRIEETLQSAILDAEQASAARIAESREALSSIG